MRGADVTASELRVLVLAPVGRDAEVTCGALRSVDIACHTCGDVSDLVREFAAGAGAIVLTPEALGTGGASTIQQLLGSQPPWSDVPVVLATAERQWASDERDRAGDVLGRPGAVTVLERPIRLVTMQTVVRAALMARRRQYQLRDLIEQLRVNVERLDAEQGIRERFVSLLAHDLRGPLSAATMAARLLVAHPERLQDRRDLALRIERSMGRADRMIQDLLDANRLRAGHRLTLDLQLCDLAEIASDVIDDLGEPDRDRVVLTAPDRLEGVWAPDQLRRALWNLITNALKYGAPAERVNVHVRRDASSAFVSVHNSGPPIPAEEQARLFKPFGRTRSSEASARGWGLGLALVRGCADAHGGTVEVSSTRETGTTFTMRLPLDARPFQQVG
jgi:signal transduction histidine kinase